MDRGSHCTPGYVQAVFFYAHADPNESNVLSACLFLELERLKSKGKLHEPRTLAMIMLGNHIVFFWYSRRPPARCMMGDPRGMSNEGWTDWPADVPVSVTQLWSLSAAGLPGV